MVSYHMRIRKCLHTDSGMVMSVDAKGAQCDERCCYKELHGYSVMKPYGQQGRNVADLGVETVKMGAAWCIRLVVLEAQERLDELQDCGTSPIRFIVEWTSG